jgi:hypothetical protein
MFRDDACFRLTPTIASIFEDSFHLLPTHLKMYILFTPTTISILHTHINKILFFSSIPLTWAHFLSLPSLTLNWMGSGERKLIFKYPLSLYLKWVSYLDYPLEMLQCSSSIYFGFGCPFRCSIEVSLSCTHALYLAQTCMVQLNPSISQPANYY